METFDFALGLLEVVLVASSAAVLVAAARRDGRRIRVAALVLPAITAVTVAHPFDVMALERDGPPPSRRSIPPGLRRLLQRVR